MNDTGKTAGDIRAEIAQTRAVNDAAHMRHRENHLRNARTRRVIDVEMWLWPITKGNETPTQP